MAISTRHAASGSGSHLTGTPPVRRISPETPRLSLKAPGRTSYLRLPWGGPGLGHEKGWGRPGYTRFDSRLRRERNCPRANERLPETGDHDEVGVLADAGEAASAERRQRLTDDA